MLKNATRVLGIPDRTVAAVRQVVIIVSASLFVALCARMTLPLPFTPVPLTVQNFGVLLVGMLLGSRRGLIVLDLYLLEGMLGLPVFTPTGPGGFAQLIGPTGGFLLIYPFVAGLAGWVAERGRRSFAAVAIGGILSEILLFAGGLSWLFALTHSFGLALRFGLYGFVFAEVIKVMFAAAIVSGWQRLRKVQP